MEMWILIVNIKREDNEKVSNYQLCINAYH